MTEREIGPPSAIVNGTSKVLAVDGVSGTLFIPKDFKATKNASLWVHFHTAPWFVISEFRRANCVHPILVFDLGQGSSTYAKPFAGKKDFDKFLLAVEQELSNAENLVKVERLSFTSFSAGYGAVRELIADPNVLKRLETVILADSMYASLDETVTTSRKVLADQVNCWRPLVDRAIDGKTTLIMTTSQITPPTYAGTWEVAKALVESTGSIMIEVGAGSSPAASVEGQRLLRMHSKGRWFVWSYEGETPMAHMTHPRHLADLILEAKK
jgi:hypothetical protein